MLRRKSGIAGLGRLRDLSIEMQRLSFHNAFRTAAAADQRSPPPRLRLVAQELAVYGGAGPVTSGVASGSRV